MISILKEKRLLAYLIGNLSSITATWGQRVIVFWIAWEISNSSAVIGTLAALELLPSVLAAPFVGVMTDRWSAMRLARDIQLLSALPPIVLFVFGLMDEITVPVLMALSVATGLLNGLDHPLRLLLVGKIVSKDKVAQGVAINSVVFNVGRMIGPTVGGWIVVTHAINLIFIFNAVSYFLFALIFTVLMKKEEKSTNDAQEDGYENQAVESFFRVAFKSNIGPMFVTFSIIALLLRPIFELLPGFTSRLQSSTIEGAQVFSWMTTAQGFGAMCGGVLISFLMTKCKIELMSLVSSFLAVGATAI
ncbi:MAG: MFS transporter, partial [Methylocystaceae bacterium]|nr:MFS transporter [Methylocystaceae bacterium]